MHNNVYNYSHVINRPFTNNVIRPPINKKKKSVNLNTMLNGTQQVLESVTTLIPLYTQVKPFVSEVHNLGKSITSKLIRKVKSTNTNKVITPEIIEKKTIKDVKSYQDLKEENKPNRPFF